LALHADGDFTYFTFRDFFHRGPGDSAVKDVALTWKYDNSTPEVSLIKKTDKWMRYERRPKRAVEFLGISRAVPPIELSYLRSNFNADIAGISPAPLTAEARRVVERILVDSTQKLKRSTVRNSRFAVQVRVATQASIWGRVKTVLLRCLRSFRNYQKEAWLSSMKLRQRFILQHSAN
jgi:hypothetical protein